MGIVDNVKGWFQKKAMKKASDQAAKAVGPKLVAKAKKDLVGTAEDALKDAISGMAADMVNEELDKNMKLPPALAKMKDKIVEAAVEAVVDATYEEIKGAITG